MNEIETSSLKYPEIRENISSMTIHNLFFRIWDMSFFRKTLFEFTLRPNSIDLTAQATGKERAKRIIEKYCKCFLSHKRLWSVQLKSLYCK